MTAQFSGAKQAPGDPPLQAQPIPKSLWLAAAERLVTEPPPNRRTAAQNLVRSAGQHGIDLSLMWGVMTAEGEVRQVCLAAPGAGRTAMLFLSGEGPESECGDGSTQVAERVASLHAAFDALGRSRGDGVRLAQALPDLDQTPLIESYEAAGMISVGVLEFLRRPLRMPGDPHSVQVRWPSEIDVCPVQGVEREADRTAVLRALNRSYEGTLDCPKLCGLRETEDVLDSHVRAGRFDPSMWWLVLHRGEPAGCVLFNESSQRGHIELTYLGVGPELRGRGLGGMLLRHGLSRLRGGAGVTVACAVDRQNTPAMRMYSGLGFARFASRSAWVRPITPLGGSAEAAG